MAVAKHNHLGGKIKAFKKLRGPFRIRFLKRRTVHPSFQLILGHRKLVLDLNLEIFKAQGQGWRQIQFGRIHISTHAAQRRHTFQFLQQNPGTHVPGVQDGIHAGQQARQPRVKVTVRVRNKSNLHRQDARDRTFEITLADHQNIT